MSWLRLGLEEASLVALSKPGPASAASSGQPWPELASEKSADDTTSGRWLTAAR